MKTKIEIKWNPQGFSEALQVLNGEVQSVAETIANRASSYITRGSGFHVEMTQKPRFHDPSYGVTRPVAYVVSNDDATAAEEAEYKIFSKAVGK